MLNLILKMMPKMKHSIRRSPKLWEILIKDISKDYKRPKIGKRKKLEWRERTN